jgi:hypothetical protein
VKSYQGIEEEKRRLRGGDRGGEPADTFGQPDAALDDDIDGEIGEAECARPRERLEALDDDRVRVLGAEQGDATALANGERRRARRL